MEYKCINCGNILIVEKDTPVLLEFAKSNLGYREEFYEVECTKCQLVNRIKKESKSK
jgi:hypothetical protein